MKKLMIIFGLLLATGVAFGQGLFGRIYTGNMLSSMDDVIAFAEGVSGDSMPAEDKRKFKAEVDKSGVTHILMNNVNTLLIGIKKGVPYLITDSKKMLVNGREMERGDFLFYTNAYYMKPQDFKVGAVITLDGKAYQVSEVDVKRMKKMIINRDMKTPSVIELMFSFNMSKAFGGSESDFLETYPDLDLDK